MDISPTGCYILEGFSSIGSGDGSVGFYRASRDLWDSFTVVSFLRTVRFFLAVPFTTTHYKRVGGISWLSKAWFGVLIFLVLVIIIDSVKSVERFENRITSLEFTAIAVAIYRFCYVLKNLFTVIKLYTVREQVGHLLTTVNKLCVPPNETEEVSATIRRKLQILAALLWSTGCLAILAVLLACYFCFSGIVSQKLAVDPTQCGWSCSTAYPILGWSPIWGTFISYSFGFFFEVGIDVFPQLLVILIIYPLGARFVHFTTSVKDLVEHGSPVRTANSPLCNLDCSTSATSNFLRRQTVFHLELSKIVLEMDKTFSFLFFIMYTGDLMAFIATASLVLHHKNGLSSGSIDMELLPIFLALVTVSTFHAVLRTSFGVWMSEKAHSVLPYLYELNLRVTSDEDKFLCSSFISRLQGSRVALTAGGFFYITREFVITIFGVLVTYVLFVYQMQDQKQDMSLLPKLEEIAAVALKLADRINLQRRQQQQATPGNLTGWTAW